MTAVLPSIAVGVFLERDEAERAVNDLKRADFPEANIGFVVRHSDAGLPGPHHGGSSAAHTGEGTAAGALVGGALGSIAGLAVVAGLLPAIGPVMAGGILVAVWAGAATGAAAGGLVGALVGLGIPEEEAVEYERHVQAGRVVVTVRAGGRYDEAIAILRKHGAYGKGKPLI